jgi:hypothetical protein
VDFVLVLAVLIPIVLGILQVALVLLAAAASEGARYAATANRGPGDGVALTRDQIDGAISGRYAQDIRVRQVLVGGAPAIEITVHASVPALGLGGPSIDLEVSGRAIEEAS